MNIQLFSRVSYIEKVLFTKHLSVMIKSGIVITEAIETLIPETKSAVFQKVLRQILSDVQNGQPMSKALFKHPRVFDNLYVNLVRVGEESGKMDENFIFLSEQMRKDYALRKKIRGVMMYPGIVMTAAGLIGGYITFFVLPQLVNFFGQLNVELPWTTKFLLGFADIMQRYGVFIVSALGALGFLFWRMVHTAGIRPYWHRVLLRAPAFGTFIRNAQLANLFRNLGVMLQSGLTITNCLSIEEEASTNDVFREYIKRLGIGVSQGKGIAKTVSTGDYPYIPALAVKMIAVGEKTGKLDEAFLYLGEFFEEEVDTSAKNISTLIEPFIFIVIGIVVLFLAFAIVTPIYQLTGSIH